MYSCTPVPMLNLRAPVSILWQANYALYNAFPGAGSRLSFFEGLPICACAGRHQHQRSLSNAGGNNALRSPQQPGVLTSFNYLAQKCRCLLRPSDLSTSELSCVRHVHAQ